MDGSRGDHVNQNNPTPEKQVSHILSHIWNLEKQNVIVEESY
jgi:hypothetical protein